MFKRIFIQKPEPLLIVTPLLLFGLYQLLSGSSAINAGNDSFMQLSASMIFWIVFPLVVVPLMLHNFLRQSRKWDAKICVRHVYITIGILLLFFVSYYISVAAPRMYMDTASNGFLRLWQRNSPGAFLLLVGWMLQVAFTLYFLRTIFKNHF